ncbi:MAG: NusG domain II-containing protein [Clostridia bacterium]|nr:NusG domain II-containing protein [Clostridia bacterium]
MEKKSGFALFGLGDAICIIAVLLTAAILALSAQIMFSTTDSPILEVNIDGKTELYPLNEDRTLIINENGISLTVQISNGTARIESTTCPDGICRSMGAISHNGQTAICAPARVALTVRNADTGGEPDAIVR